nr:MAG TPA: hypothetical protein [Caudoviricetes sp.]DAJ92497.1 MAG TPA: hypothetical protein [Caudoviricetes sp.]
MVHENKTKTKKCDKIGISGKEKGKMKLGIVVN